MRGKIILAILLLIFPEVGMHFELQFEMRLQNQLIDAKDLLIITPDKWKNNLEPLQLHKESRGIRTIIVGLSEIYGGTYFPSKGRDDPEKIKYFIKNALDKWGIKYVLLVGGKDDMPVRYSTIHSKYGEDFISDLYYADIYDDNGSFCSWDTNNNSYFGEVNDEVIIDKVDLYPDVYIGRLPCGNADEVDTVVKKIIEYENEAKPWFNNLILFGGDTQPYTWQEALLFLMFNNCRMAWEGEYIGDKVADCLKNFNAKKFYASGLRAECLTKKKINGAINEGAGFLLFVGHGTPFSVATHPPFCKRIWMPLPSGYEIRDIYSLNNGNQLPVAVFSACSCGDFDTADSPIAWEFVKYDNGGAIASFSCTTVVNSPASTLCIKTFIGYLTLKIFESYAKGKDVLGEIWSETITSYLNDEDAWFEESVIWLNHRTLEEWILFGDPSLKIG